MRRPRQFKILLSDDEKAWLAAIAKARGLTASDILRQYIRQEHAAVVRRR